MRSLFHSPKARRRTLRLAAVIIPMSAFAACTSQGSAYHHGPVCAQAERVCKHYHATLAKAGSAREGAGLELLREDCEGSQRGCSESVREALDSPIHPQGRGSMDKEWFDF